MAAIIITPSLRLETVHFHQQRVQRLFAFVVPAAQAGSAMAAHGVNFIDENDARRVFLALFEQVAHAARAHADEHFHEVRAGNRKERHVGFAGDGSRKRASCPCPEARPAARPWECARPASGISAGLSGSR